MKTKFHFLRLCFFGMFVVAAFAFTQTNLKKHKNEHELAANYVAVAATKMNVFYLGFDNPVSIAASGVDGEDLVVVGENVELEERNGKYIARAKKTGIAKIRVTAGGLTTTTEFRVKRIPNPVVRLGGTKTDGIVKSGEMQSQKGLLAMLENMDCDCRCDVESYTMYYTRVDQTPVEIKGRGASFTGAAATAIQAAKPGDQYTFIDVKAKCPGDEVARSVNGLAFIIK